MDGVCIWRTETDGVCAWSAEMNGICVRRTLLFGARKWMAYVSAERKWLAYMVMCARPFVNKKLFLKLSNKNRKNVDHDRMREVPNCENTTQKCLAHHSSGFPCSTLFCDIQKNKSVTPQLPPLKHVRTGERTILWSTCEERFWEECVENNCQNHRNKCQYHAHFTSTLILYWGHWYQLTFQLEQWVSWCKSNWVFRTNRYLNRSEEFAEWRTENSMVCDNSRRMVIRPLEIFHHGSSIFISAIYYKSENTWIFRLNNTFGVTSPKGRYKLASASWFDSSLTPRATSVESEGHEQIQGPAWWRPQCPEGVPRLLPGNPRIEAR